MQASFNNAERSEEHQVSFEAVDEEGAEEEEGVGEGGEEGGEEEG